MEIPIQTRIDAVAAAVGRVLSDDELTPYLQLLMLEAIARAIDEYIERISDQMASEQAQ